MPDKKSLTILGDVQLTFDEEMESWSGAVPMPAAWASYKGSPRDKPGKSVRVSFSQTGPKGPTQPLIGALQDFLDNQQAMHDIVADITLKYCQGLHDQDEYFPKIKNLAQLTKNIALVEIHIYYPHKSKTPCVGIQFEGDWDAEHGLGLVLQKGKVTGIGQADTSFSGPDPETVETVLNPPQATSVDLFRALCNDAENDDVRYTLVLKKPLVTQDPALKSLLVLYHPHLADNATQIINLQGNQARVIEQVLTQAGCAVSFKRKAPKYGFDIVKAQYHDCDDLITLAKLMFIARAFTITSLDDSLAALAADPDNSPRDRNWNTRKYVMSFYASSRAPLTADAITGALTDATIYSITLSEPVSSYNDNAWAEVRLFYEPGVSNKDKTITGLSGIEALVLAQLFFDASKTPASISPTPGYSLDDLASKFPAGAHWQMLSGIMPLARITLASQSSGSLDQFIKDNTPGLSNQPVLSAITAYIRPKPQDAD